MSAKPSASAPVRCGARAATKWRTSSDGAAHPVVGGEVFDRLPGLGERSRDAVRRVHPEHRHRLRTAFAKRVLAALGDVRRVVSLEGSDDYVDLALGDPHHDVQLL